MRKPGMNRITCDGCGKVLDRIYMIEIGAEIGDVCSLRCAKKWVELVWVRKWGLPPVNER